MYDVKSVSQLLISQDRNRVRCFAGYDFMVLKVGGGAGWGEGNKRILLLSIHLLGRARKMFALSFEKLFIFLLRIYFIVCEPLKNKL